MFTISTSIWLSFRKSPKKGEVEEKDSHTEKSNRKDKTEKTKDKSNAITRLPLLDDDSDDESSEVVTEKKKEKSNSLSDEFEDTPVKSQTIKKKVTSAPETKTPKKIPRTGAESDLFHKLERQQTDIFTASSSPLPSQSLKRTKSDSAASSPRKSKPTEDNVCRKKEV